MTAITNLGYVQINNLVCPYFESVEDSEIYVPLELVTKLTNTTSRLVQVEVDDETHNMVLEIWSKLREHLKSLSGIESKYYVGVNQLQMEYNIIRYARVMRSWDDFNDNYDQGLSNGKRILINDTSEETVNTSNKRAKSSVAQSRETLTRRCRKVTNKENVTASEIATETSATETKKSKLLFTSEMKKDYINLKKKYEMPELAYMLAQKLEKREDNMINYPVEMVKDMKMQKENGMFKLYILVKWKGNWPQNETEAWCSHSDAACSELIEEYMQKKKLTYKKNFRKYKKREKKCYVDEEAEIGRNDVEIEIQDANASTQFLSELKEEIKKCLTGLEKD